MAEFSADATRQHSHHLSTRAREKRRTRVAVEVGLARAAAADGEARGVVWALERRRAVRAKVDGAAGDAAALVVVDADGQVVAVNERDYTS